MKISYSWLKEFVEINKTPEQLGDDLSLFGHELESIGKMGDDTVLDLEITPNRGDCLSILGIAREISAMYNTKLKYSTSQLTSIAVANIDKKIEVKIAKPEICPRFTARIIDNIKINKSPKWMQKRLATYGFRTINNIVDVTNYVMVATGQPLHAFDYDKIKNGLMNIRLSKENEEVITLDGQNRVLPKGAIIIEDNENIYDLAGIMGGLKSEVDEKTETIVLQGAIFDPILIRKTSKYLNHITDASYRYERGVDFDGTVIGVDMAAALIKEICPEAKTGELIDNKAREPVNNTIILDMNKVNKLLGTDIDESRARDYLTRLGFRVNDKAVIAPSYRAYDIKIWQDLAEEIARMYGYNHIKKYQITNIKSQKVNLEFQKREYIKDYLTDFNFTEIYSYSFTEKEKNGALGNNLDDMVEIANPLSPETQFLRPTLLPSMLSTIAKNPWSPDINIFEIEKTFTVNAELWQLGLATTDKNESHLKMRLEFLGIKKKIENVPQNILDLYKIRRPVKYAIVDIDEIKDLKGEYKTQLSLNKYQPFSKFPPTVRDLAFIVKSDLNSDEVKKYIKTLSKNILLVEQFDEFLLQENSKNIAFHIWLQDLEKPIDIESVESIIKSIIEKVTEKFPAELRK